MRRVNNETLKYTEDDKGCWIDGAFGTSHAMRKLASLMIDVAPLDAGNLASFPTKELAEVYDVLSSGDETKLSDDQSEFDDAIEFLQDHTVSGIWWEWRDGDLILAELFNCQACEALYINGLLCHEHGCPNKV